MEEDLTEVVESVPTSPVVVPPMRKRGGGFHGRNGIDNVAYLVGSRAQRDIKCSANFMPGAFDEWNKRKPQGQYWGGYRCVGEDGIAHEFVLRRDGKDGYTTKNSVWPLHSLYYQYYPTRELRSELPKQNRMRFRARTVYNPEYDDGLTIKS